MYIKSAVGYFWRKGISYSGYVVNVSNTYGLNILILYAEPKRYIHVVAGLFFLKKEFVMKGGV